MVMGHFVQRFSSSAVPAGLAWSAKPRQGYLDRGGILQIKSVLTNDIFQDELLHIYEQKSSSRNELVQQSRKVLLKLTREILYRLNTVRR